MKLVTPRGFESALAEVSARSRLAFDLETTGLYPLEGDRICGVAIDEFYFPFEHLDSTNLLSRCLPELLTRVFHRDREIIGHNISRFDVQHVVSAVPLLGWLLRLGPKPRIRDTIIMALLVNDILPSYTLEALSAMYYRPDAWTWSRRLDAELKARGLKKAEMWKLPAHIVGEYACDGDTANTTGLYEALYEQLTAQGIEHLVDPMCDYARLLTRMERTGLKIDMQRLKEERERVAALKEVTLNTLRVAAGDAKLNPNSAPQLSRWLGLPSTAEKALLAAAHPHAKMLLEYREAAKAISTYYDPIALLVDRNHRIHPQLNLTRNQRDRGGTKSGRLSCSRPNFQALPQESDTYHVRSVVTADPGKKLIVADYERAEVWQGGVYSNEPLIFQAYHTGVNLYKVMAAELRITYKQAKILFLMMQYGAGGRKVATFFGWEVPPSWQEWKTYPGGYEALARDYEALRVRWAFKKQFPAIFTAMARYRDLGLERGFIELFTGRRCRIDPARAYAAWNRLIQGSVGEMMRLTMQRLERELDTLGAEMVLQVHDELVVEAPEETAPEALRRVIGVATDFPFVLRPRMAGGIGNTYAEAKPA